MNRYPTNSDERKAGGFTDRFVVDYTDLRVDTTASDAKVITLAALPIGTLLGPLAIRLTTAFTSSDTDFVSNALTIGDDGTANLFLTTTELNVRGTEVFNKAGTGTTKAYDAANNLKATFTPTSGKALSALSTQGSVTILATIIDLAAAAGS